MADITDLPVMTRDDAIAAGFAGSNDVPHKPIDVPDGASSLKLEDPRLPFMMTRPSVTDDASEAERPFVYLQPQAGTVLMWESWLRHEVPTNLAKADRISISFNYA